MRDMPANGRLALIRKQLIMIRRYLSPAGSGGAAGQREDQLAG